MPHKYSEFRGTKFV